MPSITRSSRKRAKVIKFLVNLKHNTDPPFDGLPSDVIIPVMGPTGVGKSSFINSLLKSVGGTQLGVEVGHGLQSCTSHLKPVVIPFARGENGETLNGFTNPNGHNVEGRLVLVDTPGFDDTYEEDSEILRRISVWLGISYVAGMKLGGVIYLHDITQTRMLGTTRRNLDMFRKLVGDNALKCVFLGTTKWELVDPVAGAERQEQLETEFWNDLIEAGAQVFSIYDQDTPEARSVCGKSPLEVVSIVDDQKIPRVGNTRNPEDVPSSPLTPISIYDQNTRVHDEKTFEAVSGDQEAALEPSSVHTQGALNDSHNHDQNTLLTPISLHNQNTFEAVSRDQDAAPEPGSVHILGDLIVSSIPEQAGPLTPISLPESASKAAGIHSQSSSNRRTPRDMVNGILTIKITHSKREFLLTIQRELVIKQMTIPQTEAGQTLKYSLDQLIALQKRKVKNLSDEEFAQGREELERLLKAVKELQVPLSVRITAPIKRLLSRVRSIFMSISHRDQS